MNTMGLFHPKEKKFAGLCFDLMLLAINSAQCDMSQGNAPDDSPRFFTEYLVLMLAASCTAAKLNAANEKQGDRIIEEIIRLALSNKAMPSDILDVTRRLIDYFFLAGEYCDQLLAGQMDGFNQQLYRCFSDLCLRQETDIETTDCTGLDTRDYVCRRWWELTNTITQAYWRIFKGVDVQPVLARPFPDDGS